MRESVKIILQCIEKIPKGPVKSIDGKITLLTEMILNSQWRH